MRREQPASQAPAHVSQRVAATGPPPLPGAAKIHLFDGRCRARWCWRGHVYRGSARRADKHVNGAHLRLQPERWGAVHDILDNPRRSLCPDTCTSERATHAATQPSRAGGGQQELVTFPPGRLPSRARPGQRAQPLRSVKSDQARSRAAQRRPKVRQRAQRGRRRARRKRRRAARTSTQRGSGRPFPVHITSANQHARRRATR